MNVTSILRARRDQAGEPDVLVVFGAGGVGKTTLSAALAVRAARAGRSVALLTLDPARRLAGALGLDADPTTRGQATLGDALVPVPGVPGLEAAMLDTKASFDALVARLTRSPEERVRILDNRVYDAFSRTLARPHAYVAIERLHALVTARAHDLVIVDTPPNRSALELVDAPSRLMRFLASDVASALVGETEDASVARELASRVARAVVARGLLGHVLGDGLVRDLAGFFAAFFPMRRGFAERAASTLELLRHRATVALVIAPEARPASTGDDDDALALARGLAARGLVPHTILVNRAFEASAAAHAFAREDGLAGDPAGPPELLRALAEARAARRRSVERDLQRETSWRSLLPQIGPDPEALLQNTWLFPLGAAPLDPEALDRVAQSSRSFALRGGSS